MAEDERRMDYPVLLFDGECGVCNGLVRFAHGHDARGTLRYAPLDGAFARALGDRFPELRAVDSIIWVGRRLTVDRSDIHVRSDAVIALCEHLGGAFRIAALVLRAFPRPIRDAGYDLFARNRQRFSPRRPRCDLDATSLRSCLID